ncbi:MAG: phosphomannomutase/phosphoglucomutase [Armatimonadetes bacterium]|nr:phosphomannomutase/phosphoglucomutase [Armatimonadota bacterium]
MSSYDCARVFKAYDVRGIYPDIFNETFARDFGHAFAQYLGAGKVALGHDMRLSSPAIARAFAEGATGAGADVVHLGQIGTDMYYFAVARYGYDGGAMVTASHNPKEYNGIKCVREKSIPISGDSGLPEIRQLLETKALRPGPRKGTVEHKDCMEEFLAHALSFIDPKVIKPLKVVMDAGNGMGGYMAQRLFAGLPLETVTINFEPDGSFPNHEPNPMLPENRTELTERVVSEKADLGIAWDGDADRCFFVDGDGEFIEGYYISAFLAESALKKRPGAKIIFDPRVIWANLDVACKYGGIPLINKSGHSFIKARMREENALFAGESSAHYYFRDNYYADSGMIPALIVLELLSESGKTLKELLAPYQNRYCISGELNFSIGGAREMTPCEQEKIRQLIAEVESRYQNGEIDRLDGISIAFGQWRFNLRSSNTEPLVRLNVEARSRDLLEEKTEELTRLIRSFA